MKPSSGVALGGKVRGGQQPVAGARVYLYAASSGATAGPAVSLLNGPGYVLTDGAGGFNITSDYSCPAGAYVYLLGLGGNPGLAAGTSNARLALAAGVGPCSSLTASSFYSINEVTTVAAASSLASIATSETQIGSTSASVLATAFGNIKNLVNPSTGVALTTTPVGLGIVPQAKIDTLANVLAASSSPPPT